MALVLPDSQTQPADQLPVLDAVHVQRLPGVLLTGRGSRLAIALVLRQQMSEQKCKTDEHKLKQQKDFPNKEDFRLMGSERVNVFRLNTRDSLLLSR